MSNKNHPLFKSIVLGNNLECPNRIIMAPLTRSRAGKNNAPTELNVLYYSQRASAGLIITEATTVSPLGQGYPHTPGISTDEQVEGWKKVTETVHDNGGRIFLQLWHVGRVSHSDYHDGELPVAPSAVKPAGEVMTPDLAMKPYETPRAVETNEIPAIVKEFRRGAMNAKKAGFDGVEIHAANGYLIDQFLCSKTNRRTDDYGGPVENRTRFLREIIEAVTEVWDPNRVGVRLSPLSDFNDMADDNPAATFGHASQIINEHRLIYLHLVEPFEPKPPILGDERTKTVFSTIRKNYHGILMANGNYNMETSRDALESGYADLISFGRAFLANPDLPKRLQQGLPLNEPDGDTFYSGGERGYTDYPTWNELQAGRKFPTIGSLEELPARSV